jgi:hypothetical protein
MKKQLKINRLLVLMMLVTSIFILSTQPSVWAGPFQTVPPPPAHNNNDNDDDDDDGNNNSSNVDSDGNVVDEEGAELEKGIEIATELIPDLPPGLINDGLLTHLPQGSSFTVSQDGSITITLPTPNGNPNTPPITIVTRPDGTSIVVRSDGSVFVRTPDGRVISISSSTMTIEELMALGIDDYLLVYILNARSMQIAQKFTNMLGHFFGKNVKFNIVEKHFTLPTNAATTTP